MCLRKPALAGVFALAVTALAISACTTAQRDQAAAYQAQIAAACRVATGLVDNPLLIAFTAPIAPWITAGCGAEAMIAQLALDPSSLAWVNGLIAMARGQAANVTPALVVKDSNGNILLRVENYADLR